MRTFSFTVAIYQDELVVNGIEPTIGEFEAWLAAESNPSFEQLIDSVEGYESPSDVPLRIAKRIRDRYFDVLADFDTDSDAEGNY